jgi:hypothetical protein
VALSPNIFVLLLQELFIPYRVVYVGVAKVVIFYIITKTFLNFFASLIILVSMTYLSESAFNTLIINPYFAKNSGFFEADGKDITFIIRKQNYLSFYLKLFFLLISNCFQP